MRACVCFGGCLYEVTEREGEREKGGNIGNFCPLFFSVGFDDVQ